jgi:hypothetical protein
LTLDSPENLDSNRCDSEAPGWLPKQCAKEPSAGV